jgi:8-oxo-dGTP diphosphatase
VSDPGQLAEGSRRIHVMAGVVRRADGMVLVAQRPAGKSLAGAWEFPGGKLEEGEDRLAGLRREFAEELGTSVETARPLIRYVHRYSELAVELDAWLVNRWRGEPHGLEGQAVAWHLPEDLMCIGLLPADAAILRALALPSVVGITPAGEADEARLLDDLESLGEQGIAGLVVLRRPALSGESLAMFAAGAACRLDCTATRLMLHGDPRELSCLFDDPAASLAPRFERILAGVHMPSRFLAELSERPVAAGVLFGVSCHDERQLARAQDLGADYAFLGPVRPTESHPGAPGIGWERFESMVRELPLPVYAIGGLGPHDLGDAWHHGAQGIAAIRSLWPG